MCITNFNNKTVGYETILSILLIYNGHIHVKKDDECDNVKNVQKNILFRLPLSFENFIAEKSPSIV